MKQTNNIEKVVQFMNSNPMNQLFVLESVSRYAKQVVENKEQLLEAMKDSMVSGEAWIKSAENWNKIDWHHQIINL